MSRFALALCVVFVFACDDEVVVKDDVIAEGEGEPVGPPGGDGQPDADPDLSPDPKPGGEGEGEPVDPGDPGDPGDVVGAGCLQYEHRGET